MKAVFKPDTLVRFRCQDGAIVRISYFCKSRDWLIPGYLGEGFYSVIHEGRELVAHENDLELWEIGEEEKGIINHTEGRFSHEKSEV